MEKVAAGQPFRPSAREWNALVDAARAIEAGALNQTFDADLPEHSQTKILIKNETGGALPLFSIVALGEPWKTPNDDLPQFKRQIVFRGVAPNPDDRDKPSDPFAILLEPLAADGIGEAVLAGVSVCQVNVIRETDTFCEVQASTQSLRSAPHGRTRILWKPDQASSGVSGTSGSPGTGLMWCVVRISDRPRFAVFELAASKWSVGEEGEPEWVKMPDCRPVFYFDDETTYRPDEQEPAATVWHLVGYPGATREDVRTLHNDSGYFPGKFGAHDWVWCIWNDHEQRWQVLGAYEDHWRFQLLEPLPRCGSAAAKLVMVEDGAGSSGTSATSGSPGGRFCPVDLTFSVRDSIGILWPPPGNGSSTTIPAGMYGIAKHFADSAQWEVIAVGEGCCGSSSSGSPTSSPPSSEPSSPPSSEPSSPPSSPPSSTPSSEPPSSQPSEPSQPPPSSEPPPPPPPESDKSTAIVPASWSPTGYTALFIAEMPEVRFDDVVTAIVTDLETLIAIDPRFVEVCEPGTIVVCGCVPELPVIVGASVAGHQVRVSMKRPKRERQPVRLTIRLTGIRRGFADHRFPDRTLEQFVANEAFIRGAYPASDSRPRGA